MSDPSHVCNLHHSSYQCQILNPLNEARDQTFILMNPSWVCYPWATTGTPTLLFNLMFIWGHPHSFVYYFSLIFFNLFFSPFLLTLSPHSRRWPCVLWYLAHKLGFLHDNEKKICKPIRKPSQLWTFISYLHQSLNEGPLVVDCAALRG